MPNLEHDPQNPTDLLDRPIAVGDVVAWGTTWGRSPALCIARIEKIRFIKKARYGGNEEVPQAQADSYQLSLRPLKSTGDVTWYLKTTGELYYRHKHGKLPPEELEAKTKIVHHVKNVVKLEPFE